MEKRIDFESITEQANRFYGNLNKNEKNLEVRSRFDIPEEYGPGLYYSPQGMIYRYIFDKDKENSFMEDIKISPICIFPYEIREYTQMDARNVTGKYIQEMNCWATVHRRMTQYDIREVVVEPRDFSSIQNFKVFMKNISISSGWVDMQSRKDLLLLIEKRIQYVFNEIGQRTKAVTTLGVHEHIGERLIDRRFVWVGAAATINENDVEDTSLKPMSRYIETDDTALTESDRLTENKVSKTYSKNIFKVNNLGVIGLILGTAAGLFLKERLYQEHRVKYPNLSIIGLSGSGKSATIEEIVLPMLGMESSNINAASMVKEFALIRQASSHNTLPVIIGEYKPDDIPRNKLDIISNLYNNAYDRASIARGNKNMGVDRYPINSSLIVLGEWMEVDQSKRDRSILVQTDHKDMDQKSFMEITRLKHISTRIGKTMLCKALGIREDKLRDMFYYNKRHIKELMLAQRPEDNILCCLLGLDLFSIATGINVGPAKMAAVSRFMKDTMENSSTATNAVEELLQEISLAAKTGFITADYIKTDDEYVYIAHKDAFPELEMYYKQRGKKLKMTPANFRRQAVGLKYVNALIDRKYYDIGLRRSCIAFKRDDLEIIQDTKDLDFSGLGVTDYTATEREGIEKE